MKKLSIFKLFATVTLAATGAFAVGASLSNKKAEAVSAIGSGDTIYVNLNSNWQGQISNSVSLWMHCWNTNNDATDVEFSNVSANVYSATLPSSCNNIIFFRSNAGTVGNWWDQSADLVLSNILTGGNNVVKQGDGWTFVVGDTEEYRPEKAAGSAYLRGSWSGGWADFTHQMTVSGDVCSINNVLLSAGEQIKVVKLDSYNYVKWYDASSLSGNSDATFVSPNVTINTTGRYNISVNTSTKVYTVNVYEDLDLNAAIAFCDDFETSMAKYCPIAGTEDDKGTAKLVSEWSSFATRYSSSLSQQAKDYLLEGENSSVEKITDFTDKYDSILSDYYSLLSSYNFLSRTVAHQSRIINEQLLNNSSTKTIAIVIIVSLVSITAIGGYFFIKRRQEN